MSRRRVNPSSRTCQQCDHQHGPQSLHLPSCEGPVWGKREIVFEKLGVLRPPRKPHPTSLLSSESSANHKRFPKRAPAVPKSLSAPPPVLAICIPGVDPLPKIPAPSPRVQIPLHQGTAGSPIYIPHSAFPAKPCFPFWC